jgi:hypothetical protein
VAVTLRFVSVIWWGDFFIFGYYNFLGLVTLVALFILKYASWEEDRSRGKWGSCCASLPWAPRVYLLFMAPRMMWCYMLERGYFELTLHAVVWGEEEELHVYIQGKLI